MYSFGAPILQEYDSKVQWWIRILVRIRIKTRIPMKLPGGSPLCRTKKFRPIKTKRMLQNGRNVTEVGNGRWMDDRMPCGLAFIRFALAFNTSPAPLLIRTTAFLRFYFILKMQQNNIWNNRRSWLGSNIGHEYRAQLPDSLEPGSPELITEDQACWSISIHIYHKNRSCSGRFLLSPGKESRSAQMKVASRQAN